MKNTTEISQKKQWDMQNSGTDCANGMGYGCQDAKADPELIRNLK